MVWLIPVLIMFGKQSVYVPEMPVVYPPEVLFCIGEPIGDRRLKLSCLTVDNRFIQIIRTEDELV